MNQENGDGSFPASVVLHHRFFLTFLILPFTNSRQCLCGSINQNDLLDLSSAFDTVGHDIWMRRLGTKLELMETAVSWLSPYLTVFWTLQKISFNGNFSDLFELKWGVPQGSCLGPLLFTIYARKLFDIIESNLPIVHVCADDTVLNFIYHSILVAVLTKK